VVVAVIDSGLDIDHADIASNVYVNAGEIPLNGIDDDGNGFVDDARGFNAVAGAHDPIDFDGHGTSVAGVIAAQGNNSDGLVGVAPNAKILAIKASEEGAFTMASILAGVDYVLKAKRRGVNVRVVNASFGGAYTCSPAEREYVSALHSNNILLVAAAGNSAANNDQTPASPANCESPSLLSVASVSASGSISDFSNFGAKTVDVAAPGSGIVMLSPDSGYTVGSGTSMAAPYVSGVAALLFANNPRLTPTEARRIIMNTVKPLKALEGKVVSPGIVSAAGALGLTTQLIPSPPVGTLGTPISYSAATSSSAKKAPITITISEPLSVQSVGCFKASVSPSMRGHRVDVKVRGSVVAFELVQVRGRRTVRVGWPSKRTLSVTIKGNCAFGQNGSLLDSDLDGVAGGRSRTLKIRLVG
jgi:subtilisin family serine protease